MLVFLLAGAVALVPAEARANPPEDTQPYAFVQAFVRSLALAESAVVAMNNVAQTKKDDIDAMMTANRILEAELRVAGSTIKPHASAANETVRESAKSGLAAYETLSEALDEQLGLYGKLPTLTSNEALADFRKRVANVSEKVEQGWKLLADAAKLASSALAAPDAATGGRAPTLTAEEQARLLKALGDAFGDKLKKPASGPSVAASSIYAALSRRPAR